MKTLKSLAIFRRDSYDRYYHLHSCIIRKLLVFLKRIQQDSRSLERLIINNEDDIYDSILNHADNFGVFLEWFMTGSLVKSFALHPENNFWENHSLTLLDHERFRELEQLVNITFSNRLENLTELKSVRGRCGDDIQVFLNYYLFLLIYN